MTAHAAPADVIEAVRLRAGGLGVDLAAMDEQHTLGMNGAIGGGIQVRQQIDADTHRPGAIGEFDGCRSGPALTDHEEARVRVVDLQPGHLLHEVADVMIVADVGLDETGRVQAIAQLVEAAEGVVARQTKEVDAVSAARGDIVALADDLAASRIVNDIVSRRRAAAIKRSKS